jgi:hypothetical protein
MPGPPPADLNITMNMNTGGRDSISYSPNIRKPKTDLNLLGNI